MKRYALLLTLILFAFNLVYSQIAITEISYNPPEGGTDSLEYIELYNYGDTEINLEGYRFTRGVNMIFPEIILPAGGYVLLTGNASAFMNVYGLESYQWTSDALSNNGERITIVNVQNVEVADVNYRNVAPWPTFADGTNGGGRSIEICNPLADANDGNNWKVSENDLGFEINGRQVFGTPGAANSIEPCGQEPDATVLVSSNVFTPRDITINVGQTVRWINTGGNHNVNGSIATFPDNPASFGNGTPSTSEWTYDFTFTIEGVYQYQCDPHVDFDMKGTVTVISEVVNDPYPRRTIAEMKGVNADGVPDSLNVQCTMRGIVHGGNYRTSGLQFFILDAAGRGMSAFSNSSTFGYTVQEGDEVDIKGTLEQFNGLAQLVLVDVVRISQNNSILAPKVVTVFSEQDESSLVMIEGVDFVNPAQWTGTGAGFNVTMTNGSNNFTVRITNGTNAYAAPIPMAGAGNIFNVAGILTQFDSDIPYNSGYQLTPRYLADFMSVSSAADIDVFIRFSLYPNPSGNSLQIRSAEIPDRVDVSDVNGRVIHSYFHTDRLDVSQLKAGTYYVKVIKGENSGISRFVKL